MAGIPEGFPIIGGMLPNWFHEFVAGTLQEHLGVVAFDPLPLLVSIGVSLGGLGLGWLVYRSIPAKGVDPVAKWLGPIYSLLANKYFVDELYDLIFIRPSIWISEKFTYLFIDRGLIDGLLHSVARLALMIGGFFRNYIDKPIVNGFGDFVGISTQRAGQHFRKLHTGRIQQYMLMALVLACGGLFYYLFVLIE